MSTRSRSNLYLGLFCLGFALLLLFVWIPLDTDTGWIEKVRRQVTIGDSLAPSVAGIFLLVGGIILILIERSARDQPKLTGGNLRFIGSVLLILFISFAIMRYCGPLLVSATNIFTGETLEYRLLRDTVPWKYAGYFPGGIVLISGLISLIEGRLTARSVVISAVAVVVLIAIYDLPFDDLLLPPNGDV
ncbi:MAG: hypothetical protein GY742_00165 [Hyphomicrobiales bacterium]|nr:hypothetical protein [Hyphomicrobiales bacterium]